MTFPPPVDGSKLGTPLSSAGCVLLRRSDRFPPQIRQPPPMRADGPHPCDGVFTPYRSHVSVLARISLAPTRYEACLRVLSATAAKCLSVFPPNSLPEGRFRPFSLFVFCRRNLRVRRVSPPLTAPSPTTSSRFVTLHHEYLFLLVTVDAGPFGAIGLRFTSFPSRAPVFTQSRGHALWAHLAAGVSLRRSPRTPVRGSYPACPRFIFRPCPSSFPLSCVELDMPHRPFHLR